MENHLLAFTGLIISILFSILLILVFWSTHKVWSIILIIIFILLGIIIGDFFDRKKLKQSKHLFDM